MTRPMLLALLTFSVVACGGGSTATATPASSPSAVAVTLTLSATGCKYDGPAQMKAGRLQAHMVNQTPDRFYLAVGLIESPHTLADMVAWVQPGAAAQHTTDGPPDWFTDIADKEAPANVANPILDTVVRPGLHGFVCSRNSAQAVGLGIWAVGPLQVSS